MEAFFEDYLECLEKLHTEITRALEGLPSEALDWVPGEGMNSISQIVFHIAGAERYWIGDVIAQSTSYRDRESEFSVQEVGLQPLQRRLDSVLNYSRMVLQMLHPQNLTVVRISPRDGRRFRVSWVLAHVLEHTGIHLGHMQITRQLWEQKIGENIT